jgi:hypothetical protein
VARKPIKTKSPKARQRSHTLPYERAALDLCRIDTARLRSMSTEQLKAAERRVGPIHMLPKKERGTSFRYLLSSFINALVTARKMPVTERDVTWTEYGWTEANNPGYFERYPQSNASIEWEDRTKFGPNDAKRVIERNKRYKAGYEDDANRREREIWELQARAGCKIRDAEIVARDAEYQGDRETADRLRREARRPPTGYKGRKPIIR